MKKDISDIRYSECAV